MSVAFFIFFPLQWFLWQVTGDRWHVTGDMWQVTGDRWQVTGPLLYGYNQESWLYYWLVEALLRTPHCERCGFSKLQFVLIITYFVLLLRGRDQSFAEGSILLFSKSWVLSLMIMCASKGVETNPFTSAYKVFSYL